MKKSGPVEAYLKATYEMSRRHLTRPRIECADGFTMSVQGGHSWLYCKPREDCNIYEEVAIGFPSQEEPLLMPYCESPDKPTDTIYGYVPISVAEAVVAKHGGIK
jgi:hypothetical protein